MPAGVIFYAFKARMTRIKTSKIMFMFGHHSPVSLHNTRCLFWAIFSIKAHYFSTETWHTHNTLVLAVQNDSKIRYYQVKICYMLSFKWWEINVRVSPWALPLVTVAPWVANSNQRNKSLRWGLHLKYRHEQTGTKNRSKLCKKQFGGQTGKGSGSRIKFYAFSLR